MLTRYDAARLGTSALGWLRSRFHFSFAGYHDPARVRFGVLRVVNDDLVEPGTGFDTHLHRDMEIVSYVIDGELTHGDSMGNRNTLSRGHVQYMSAGTGVLHSEHNLGDPTLRFLQIWIFPDEKGLAPAYGDHRFDPDARRDRWLTLVSGPGGDAPIKLHQDVHIRALELGAGREMALPVAPGRQAYLVQIEGASEANGVELGERDGLEIVGEDVVLTARETSHFLVIEMPEG